MRLRLMGVSPLDVFKENGYAKDDDELTMWLSLLATDSIAEAEALIMRYPYLEEIYMEMSEYMRSRTANRRFALGCAATT